MTSVLRYIGGKTYLASWIIKHFPRHTCYVEVFGGSAAVLFRKKKSAYEVYNDLESEVYNFFKVLRDNGKALQDYLKVCPASRQLFEEWIKKDPNALTDLKHAVRFFYISNLSFSGRITDSSFPIRSGFRRYGKRRGGDAVDAFKRKVDKLLEFQERLRWVTVENMDYEELITKYDAPQTFFYADPPYIEQKHYCLNFSETQHRRLANLAHTIKGKIMISYYPHPLVNELYSLDEWHYRERDTVAHAMMKLEADPRKELLLMNYDPQTDKFVSEQVLDSFVKKRTGTLEDWV